MKVTFLSLGSDADAFYGKLTAFMRLAASALDVELEVVECHRDTARMRREAEALLARETLPEYLLTANHQSLALSLIPRANAAGVKVFLINEGLLVAEKATLGKPRDKYPRWLGEIVPDDHHAGYLLAEVLIAEARRRGKHASDGKIHLSAVAGSFTISSISRVGGLREAVGEHDDVLLTGALPANWEKARARELTAQILTHYPETSVVWSASDYMALGVAEAIEAAGKTTGEDVLVGGVDWAPFVPDKIREGVLTTSMGGHFMDGAWAMVLLYDYHHGVDFKVTRMGSKMVALTRDSMEKYSVFFDQNSWSDVDFARFSKARNPAAGHYDLTLDAILKSPEEIAI